MQNSSTSLSIALLGALLLSTSLYAQTPQGGTGPISGPVSIQDDSTAAPTTTTRLNGVVVSSLDGKPVPRVLVTSADRRMAVMTDSEGRFSFDLRRPVSQSSPQVFSSFPPTAAATPATIPVLFTLRKPGYIGNSINIQLPAAPPDTPEPPIQLKIVPAATLTGHVYADSGDMPDNISVQLYGKQINQGTAAWNPNRSSRVDSRGQFRFANLPPGEYKLVAPAYDTNLGSDDPTPPKIQGFRAAFYPNGDSLDSAAPLHLGPGETVNADLTFRAANFYSVTVPVTGTGAPNGFQISLIAAAPGLSMNYADQSAQGYLPNGSYDLILNANDPAPGNQIPTMNIASVHLQVDGKPIQLQPVALHPAPDLQVIMHTEFNNTTLPTPNPQRPQTLAWVNLQPANNFGLRPQVQNNNDGSMVLRNLTPGTFHVTVGTAVGGYVAAVTSGTTDLLREPLRVVAGSDPRPIEITLRDDFASLTGHIVTDPTDPASPVTWVLCIPLDRPEAQPTQAVTQQNQLSLPSIPPGRYLILTSHSQFLFQNIEYRNEDILRDLTSKGTTITLSPGQKADIEIPLMPEDATQ